MAREKKPGGPKDADGREIPPHLLDVFAGKEKLDAVSDDLGQALAHLEAFTAAIPAAFSKLNAKAFIARIEQAQQLLYGAIPSIVCPYCGGEQSSLCKPCKGSGFLSRFQAICVPKDVLDAAKENGAK